jgi:hypothetical protein
MKSIWHWRRSPLRLLPDQLAAGLKKPEQILRVSQGKKNRADARFFLMLQKNQEYQLTFPVATLCMAGMIFRLPSATSVLSTSLFAVSIATASCTF